MRLGVGCSVRGLAGLLTGGFSFTKNTTKAEIGPLKLQVQEKESVNVPQWLSLGAMLVGGVLYLEQQVPELGGGRACHLGGGASVAEVTAAVLIAAAVNSIAKGAYAIGIAGRSFARLAALARLAEISRS